MDFDSSSGRRLLQALEDIGGRMNVLYKTLPELREQFAPDWTGDAADLVTERLGQYREDERKVAGNLDEAAGLLRNAIEIAEALDRVFEGGGS